MGSVDVGIIIGYLILTLVIGLYQGQKIKSIRDYAIADRSFAGPFLISTLVATFIGGENTIGIAEKVFTDGLIYVFISMAFPVNALLISFVATRHFEKFEDCFSAGDIMEKNYGWSGKVITGLSGTLLSIGYVGAQIGAIGYLLSYFLEIPYQWSVIIGSGLVVIYTTSGGIRSVTMTDVIQFAALMITIPAICSFGLQHFGGYEGLLRHIPDSKLDLSPETISYSSYTMLFFIFCIPFLDPAVVQRMLMAKDRDQIRTSLNLAALLEVPFYLTIALIAFIALALAPQIDPNSIFPFLIDQILPLGFKGFVVAGLLAVIMSTADSYLNVAGITFVHDFLKPLSQSKIIQEKELLITKISTLLIGIFSIFAALQLKSIMDLILSFLNVWGPIVVIPLFATLFGLRTNKYAFLGSAFAGVSVFVFWIVFDLEKILGLDSLLPSMGMNALTFFTIHFIMKKSLGSKFHLLKKPRFLNKMSLSSKISETFFSDNDTPPYFLFGFYALINYIFPYFFWPEVYQIYPHALLLKMIAALLFFSLLFLDKLRHNNSVGFLAYWYVVLAYCLPFLSSYLLFLNEFHWFWMVHFLISTLFLSILVDSKKFLLLLGIGFVLASVLFFIWGDFTELFEKSKKILLPLIYVYSFALVFGFIFSRRRELIYEEKLRTMKFMGGTIAHEIRAPLASIEMNCKIIRKDPEDLDKSLETIERVVTNAQAIIDNLLAKISHQKKILIQTCDLNDLIKKTLSLYPYQKFNTNRIKLDLAQGPLPVKVDEHLFVHVILNLIKNATESLERAQKGDIFIRTYVDKGAIFLSVKDTGEGMSQQRKNLLFKEFFSTRKGGTGLGLFFVKKVLVKMGMTIVALTKEGHFTEMIVNCGRQENA